MSGEYKQFGKFLRENPMAYAGYRGMFLMKNNVKIPERSSLPLLGTPAFPAILFLYFVYMNIQWRISRVFGSPDSSLRIDDNTHMFVVNSSVAYRSKSLLSVAESIDEKEGDAVLFCSPSTEGERRSWKERGLSVISHQETHKRLFALRLLPEFTKAVIQTIKLYRNIEEPVPLRKGFLILNLVFLEYAKSASLGTMMSGTPTIHTVKNGAYLWPHSDEESFYVYQEGIAWSFQDRDIGFPDNRRPFITQAPFHKPATYLIWSEVWRENFQASAHPESKIVAVGSPYYDWLRNEQKQVKRHQTDIILFIGASQDAQSADQEEQYESLLRQTAAVAKKTNRTFVIKPHPADNIEWYEERGYKQYLQNFSGIVEALQQCEVAATNASSAFVESSVIGTQMIVRDLFGLGLSRLGPVEFVSFADTDEEYARLLFEVEERSGAGSENKSTELVCEGDSTANIVALTT